MLPISLPKLSRTLIRTVQLAITVDDVVGAATRDGVVAGAAEQDVAGAEDGAVDRAEARSGVRDDRRRALGERLRHDRVEAVDAIHARLVEHVAAGEAGPAHGVRSGLGALDDVVERRAGIGLGLLPAVAVDDHLDRQADEVVVDLHVVVGRDGVVLMEGPVEAACAGVAVDGRVLGHQVVAALGVVVVLARLTDEDVIAGSDLRRVVEERRTVIALQQVLTGSAFDPVVAAVAEHGIGALTGDDEVIARAAEGLVVVGAAVHEVLTVGTDHEVVAGAGVEGVVAGAALERVGTVEVGDDVIAVATEGDVVAAAAIDDVVAVATPEGVVVVAADDAVDAGGAVVDRLSVDAGRVDRVALPVRDRAVGHAHEQQALVTVRASRGRPPPRSRAARSRPPCRRDWPAGTCSRPSRMRRP